MKNFSKLNNTIIVAVLMVGITACSEDDGNNSNQQQNQSGVIPSVEAVQARFGSLPLVERFSGNVRSENQVALYPEISGVVQKVFVQDGDYVDQGDPIVKLNTGILEKQLQQAEANFKISNAQLKQAQAQFNEIRNEYRRVKQLEEKDLTSEAEVDQIEVQLLSAEAEVELAEAQRDQSASLVEQRREELSKAIIKAPISGTVGQRNAQIGMQANTNTQLFLIGDLSKLKVEIILTEEMLNQINVGQTARILIKNRNGQQIALDAEISRISPFLNEVSRSTEAEIDVNNKDGLLRPGMFVPVDILFGESQQATLIPVSALYTNTQTGESGVFLARSLGSEIEPVSDSSANGSDRPAAMSTPTPVEFVPINVIAQGRMELGVSGIESGQWIVTIGQDMLAEGREQARVRSMSWDRIYELQNLQREDLLEQIMQERDRPENNMNL
ncbi:efflux RND transporter periplasmic adaptor subunit [Gracilimonas sp. Q87]|uniref:efflux RND transporter periplasmic adaptor subunit n=1 Tax=Gracilimonas sp. Q87 TaxID=3384766 RepID=UPI003984107F